MAENTKESGFTKAEVDAGKGMAILSYIIALIPYFAEKNNKFVRFHAVQGMNILLVAVGWSIVSQIILAIVSAATLGSCYGAYYSSLASCTAGAGIIGVLSLVFGLVSLAIGILDLVGLIYAAQGQAKKVPILGKIRIIKK